MLSRYIYVNKNKPCYSHIITALLLFQFLETEHVFDHPLKLLTGCASFFQSFLFLCSCVLKNCSFLKSFIRYLFHTTCFAYPNICNITSFTTANQPLNLVYYRMFLLRYHRSIKNRPCIFVGFSLLIANKYCRKFWKFSLLKSLNNDKLEIKLFQRCLPTLFSR